MIFIFFFSIGCGPGGNKACFRIGCDVTGSCKVVVSYELSGTDILFKMAGRSNGYIAVGLSPDNDKMGDDLTTGKTGDLPRAWVSWDIFRAKKLCNFCLSF